MQRRPSLNSFPSRTNISHHDGASLHEASNYFSGGTLNEDSTTLSYSSSLVKKRRKVRPLYPADSDEKHVEYILVAGFDIDRGSVMEHQYPAPIGGDEHMLADLMLPEGTHVRGQDWTMFFLHKDTSEDDEEKEKKAERRRRREARKKKNAEAAALQQQQDDLGAEDDDESDRDEDDEALANIQGPPLVYVLNLVNTKQDKTVKRSVLPHTISVKRVPC